MRRLRKKVGEDLSEANIKRVVQRLNTSHQPITKKEACNVLKIAYNAQRLTKIIEEYHERVEYKTKRRAQKRGTYATPDEITDTIRAHLRGDPITDIANNLFRTVPFVRNIIESVGIPTRGANQDERSTTGVVPEQCVAESFDEGELVWSARDHATATVLNRDMKIDYEQKYGSKCYTIFVHETSEEFEHLGPGYYSSALAYDLGSLKHLQEYNIDLKNIS